MKGLFVAALALTIAAPAIAQDGDARPTIWGDLKQGMTRKEVNALHPGIKSVKLSETCGAQIATTYDDKGGLLKIKLSKYQLMREVNGDGHDCGKLVLNSLESKYGEPARRVAVPYKPYDIAFLDTVAVFNSGALVVSYTGREIADTGSNDEWAVEYHLVDLNPDTSAASKL